MPDLQFSALELRDAIRRGELSPVESVRQALEASAQQAALGAFVSIGAELALQEARAQERLIQSTSRDERQTLPPLVGVPTAHKDLVDQRGLPSTRGTASLPHRVARRDEPVVRDTRAAGAISIGKTQVPEFGIAAYSENEIAAPARNPFDTELTAGGSSGGSAAAVASGVIPLAVGSDAGGSIRIPSAACGLVGLKPGRSTVPADLEGRVLNHSGVPALAVSGPIARTASDAALLFDALLGRGDEPNVAAVRRADELQGLRIGLSLASPFDSWIEVTFSRRALEAIDRAVSTLRARGHAVEDARIAYDERYPEAFTTSWTSALESLPLTPEGEGRLGSLATMFLQRSRSTPRGRLADAARALHEFAEDASMQWSEYDAVLTPALAFVPPRVGAFQRRGPEGDYRLQCEWAPQTSMVNVTGLPAITAPVLRDDGELPMGVQLIGRHGSETRLLQLAEQLMQG